LKLAKESVAVQVAVIDGLAQVENERRDRALELLTASQSLAEAEANLADIRDDVDPSEGARRRLESVREQNRLEQEAYQDRIRIARATIAELQKIEVESARTRVKTLREELKNKGGPGADGTEGLETELADATAALSKLQNRVVGGQEDLAKLQQEAAVSAIQGRTQEIALIGQVIEKERSLQNERLGNADALAGAAATLRQTITSIFKAQANLSNSIRSRLDQAGSQIKSRRGQLDQAYSQLASARESLINALQGGADAFAEYNAAIQSASVEADRLLGKFLGFRDEASALANAFDASIEAARMAGASEQQLAELRAEAASEQLRIYEALLDDTRSKAEQWFTSSAQDRQEFVRGLSNLQSIVGQFQGNIDNFRNMNPDQLNDFGAQLISLPQDVRQGMLAALEQLPDGVGIGGLTADEIKEILLGGAFGESEELGIESLSETMLTVAELMRAAAEAQTAGLIEAQKQTADLNAQVQEAREGVRIAKAMLDQSVRDAALIQKGIADVKSTIDNQLSGYRQEFIDASNRIEAGNKTDAEKIVAQELEANRYLKNIEAVLSNTGGLINNVQPGSEVRSENRNVPLLGDETSVAVLRTIGGNIAAASTRLAESVDGLRTLSNNWNAGLESNRLATAELARQMTAIATKEYLTKTEAQINIDNQQKIQITGATEMANQILSVLTNQGWITDAQLDLVRDALRTAIVREVEAGIAPASDLRGV
jgi:hypothetical protein